MTGPRGQALVRRSRYSTAVVLRWPPSEDGKFIAIETEADLDAEQSYRIRHESLSFRQYELAGVAHIPTDLNGLETIGAKRQSTRSAFGRITRPRCATSSTGSRPARSRQTRGTSRGGSTESDNRNMTLRTAHPRCRARKDRLSDEASSTLRPTSTAT